MGFPDRRLAASLHQSANDLRRDAAEVGYMREKRPDDEALRQRLEADAQDQQLIAEALDLACDAFEEHLRPLAPRNPAISQLLDRVVAQQRARSGFGR
jgi:hypothetical protein